MKKGFTLIELLAVIVILAIIALIATPIVLNIINDTKESANLRSAEMYLDAVEQGIARGMLQNKYLNDGTYNISTNGDICINDDCTNILTVEVDGDVPRKGNITINNGSIDGASLELGNKTLGISGNGGVAPVCLLSSDSDKTGTQLGAKYECEVRPGVKYNFYVLSNELDGSTNLIMDMNICSDGTPATEDNTCLVAWYADAMDNSDGPVTAMTNLYNATKSWINIPLLNYEYYDKEWQESLGISILYGYDSFTSEDGIGKINGDVFTRDEPLRARMPIYALDSYTGTEYGEVWMRNNQTNMYWTLSSVDSNDTDAWTGYSHAVISDANRIGVRPVINIKL